jgi:hypothetical protein
MCSVFCFSGNTFADIHMLGFTSRVDIYSSLVDVLLFISDKYNWCLN